MGRSFQIRVGTPSDADCLSVLATQVWLHTYATDGITDVIAQYILAELTPTKMVASLSDPDTCFFVVEYKRGLVGFATIKFGVPCPGEFGPGVELQTLYVQEHFVGFGVGKSLLHTATAKTLEQPNLPLWLTVNAKNTHAIAFYERQGFSRISSTFFVLGQERHENYLLIRRNR